MKRFDRLYPNIEAIEPLHGSRTSFTHIQCSTMFFQRRTVVSSSFWQKTEYPDLSHGCRDLNEEIRSILSCNHPFMARTAFTAGEQLEVTRRTGSVVQCRARCGHGESFSLASDQTEQQYLQFLKFFYKMNSFL